MASFIQGIWGIRNEQTSESNVQKPSFANLEKYQKKETFQKQFTPLKCRSKYLHDNYHQDDIHDASQ